MTFMPPRLMPHLKHGLKMGLAGVSAYLLAHAMGLFFPYIAVVSAVMVLQAYVSESILIASYRVVGTVLGALVSLGLLLLYPQEHWQVSLGLFAGLVFSGVLTSRIGHLRIVGITVTLVFLVGLDMEDKHAMALDRVAEIVIGVLCSLSVSILVWPKRASRQLWTAQSELYAEGAARCQELLNAFVNGQRTVDMHNLDKLDELLHTCRQLVPKALGREINPTGRDSRGLLRRMELAKVIRDDLYAMAEALARPSGKPVDFLLAPHLWSLGASINAALLCLSASQPGQDDNTEQKLDEVRQAAAQALAAADKRLDELHRAGTTSRREMPKLRQFFAFYHALRSLALAMGPPSN